MRGTTRIVTLPTGITHDGGRRVRYPTLSFQLLKVIINSPRFRRINEFVPGTN